MRTIRTVLAALAVAIAVTAPGAALAGTAPDGSGPGSGPTTDARLRMAAQEPLRAAASRIRWSVEDGGSTTGYAGIGLGAGEVVVWWKGALPPVVQDAVAQARRTVPVRVAAATHSRAELAAAAAGVAHYLRANPDSPYHGVDIAYDGSGLVVNADPGRARPATLPAGMAPPAGIRVSVSEEQRLRLTGRLNDTAPYWGGGRITNTDNGGSCTAGFPVTTGAVRYMLTAGHCGRPGGGWNNGNNSRFFGTGAYENVPHDLLLISASVDGRIWDGGVGSGEFTKGVAGWDWVFPGEWLCSSGSVTGALCNHVVGDNFVFTGCGYDAYGNYECYDDLIRAHQFDGLTAARPGDSGGPVFGLSGSDRVIAKGTITGVVGGTDLIFQDFATAWRDFCVTPVLG